MRQTPLPEGFSFGERLAFLRQSLSEADPLTAPEPLPLATANGEPDAANALASAFHAAPPEARAAYLLRALDDAIVALDLSAQLADEFTVTPGVPLAPQSPAESSPSEQPKRSGKLKKWGKAKQVERPETPNDPLLDAYIAFVASQPALQALYHYRNALAASLRLAPRAIPPAVTWDAATEPADDADGDMSADE